jgi:arginyl-tRNA synthetase
MRKAKEKNIPSEFDYALLGNTDELQLLQKIVGFSEAIALAQKELNPLRVVTQVYEIAKAFNQFYATSPVLGAENEALASARLALISATARAIKKGLTILGIEVLEQM